MPSPENPFFDRIVLPKERHIENFEKYLHEYVIEDVHVIGGKPIEDFEIAKTEEDIRIIDFVNQRADEILKEYGRAKIIQVPLENIHLMNPGGVEAFTEGLVAEGAHAAVLRSTLIDRCKSNLQFATNLFHELMHLKSYTALQLTPGTEDQKLMEYRTGISVTSRDGKTEYLHNVGEAIIGYLTAKFVESARNDETFLDESDRKEIVDTSRQEELEKLNHTIDDIYAKNQDTFKSREEVLNAFIDAQVNGRLLKIAKVVERTFGEGTLKKIDFQTIA